MSPSSHKAGAVHRGCYLFGGFCYNMPQMTDLGLVHWGFGILGLSLSEEHPNEVPQVFNCERPVENLSCEHIRGTDEELESFTKDGNLKLALEVLNALEKKE
ncbi:hypothetical protein QQ045_008476 [Rhodiola kirilowii]